MASSKWLLDDNTIWAREVIRMPKETPEGEARKEVGFEGWFRGIPNDQLTEEDIPPPEASWRLWISLQHGMLTSTGARLRSAPKLPTLGQSDITRKGNCPRLWKSCEHAFSLSGDNGVTSATHHRKKLCVMSGT